MSARTAHSGGFTPGGFAPHPKMPSECLSVAPGCPVTTGPGCNARPITGSDRRQSYGASAMKRDDLGVFWLGKDEVTVRMLTPLVPTLSDDYRCRVAMTEGDETVEFEAGWTGTAYKDD